MNAQEIEKFKILLLSEQEKHKKRIEALKSDKTRQKGPISADSAEAAQDIENDEVVDGLEDLEIKQLHLIDAALQRIEAGTFGICINCQNEISLTRMKAIPFSKNCIDCSH